MGNKGADVIAVCDEKFPNIEINKYTDIAFFFGAGAESDKKGFNLPSGSEYTYRTMQHRQDKLYQKLEDFYKMRLHEGYVKEYRKSFLFERDSHTFREIIYRAALQYHDDGNAPSGILEYDEFVKCALKVNELNLGENNQEFSDTKDELKRSKEELKEKAKTVYDRMIKNDKDLGEAREDGNSKANSLKSYLSFYGAVEKDFSAIIAPNKAGLTQFWRVINYFWSAFFTILEPMCINFEWYKEISSDKKKVYQYVLNNLKSVISSVYNDYDYSALDEASGNYYKLIAEKFPNCMAITTNYTPFVEHYFPKNNVYLAGRLSEFEFPCELSVKNLTEEELDDSSFVFPFLMTQAPVKPIIGANQIREYAAMLGALSKADTIVIIGYSLGAADNHINAMLREYALHKDKRIIYCYYDEENKREPKDVRAKVFECLKLSEDMESNISIIKNNGNAERLVNQLASELKIGYLC